MNKKVITIDELMSMSKQELNKYMDRYNKLLAEGIVEEEGPIVDSIGMTIDEIISKYELISIDEAYENIMRKLWQ